MVKFTCQLKAEVPVFGKLCEIQSSKYIHL